MSDIAATGGAPEHALVTLALPRDRDAAWARGIYAGIGRAAREYGVNVVGGETASTPGPGWVSVCLTGRVPRAECVTRGGGRVGDGLFVTGRLGGSFATGHHLDFRPRLAEARWLVSHFRVRAMMDLSDGLAADLPRLARASGTGFVVDPESLPVTEGCSAKQALGDGEDYELLFALSPRDANRLLAAWRRKFPSRATHPRRRLARHREPPRESGARRATTTSRVGDYLSCARTSWACLTRTGSVFNSTTFW